MRKGLNEYSEDWAEVSQAVKDAAGWKCIRCGHVHEMGHILTVHHLDMNKANNAWWNTAALCQVCHLHIQAKVVMDRPWLLEHSEWFKPFVAGYYAHLLGADESREYVLAHLEDLISSMGVS